MITAREIYLDYVNDWLSIKSMSNSPYYISYGLNYKKIKQLISEGRIVFNWQFYIGTMK